jgi:hypothetical protein
MRTMISDRDPSDLRVLALAVVLTAGFVRLVSTVSSPPGVGSVAPLSDRRARAMRASAVSRQRPRAAPSATAFTCALDGSPARNASATRAAHNVLTATTRRSSSASSTTGRLASDASNVPGSNESSRSRIACFPPAPASNIRCILPTGYDTVVRPADLVPFPRWTRSNSRA